MKKKLLLLSAIAVCLAVLSSGTLAFFTAEDTAHNVITSSAVNIEIEEWQATDNGSVPYPKDEPIPVMPGTSVSKIAAVKSLEAEAYIRARFEIVFLRSDGTPLELSPETVSALVSLGVNKENWFKVEGDELWWYYTGSVAAGASTEAFFTEVIFDGPAMTNEYQNCTALITVYAQAVQSANNGSGAADATGWPEA